MGCISGIRMDKFKIYCPAAGLFYQWAQRAKKNLLSLQEVVVTGNRVIWLP